jgi:ubiquitin-like domain-containing CTD phosphatase 1
MSSSSSAPKAVEQDEGTKDGQEPAEAKVEEREIELTASWKGQLFPLLVYPETTVAVVKRHLSVLTNVQPKRQKLIFSGAKAKSDDVTISQLKIKKRKFMMVGVPESDVFIDSDDDYKSVVDDFDEVEYTKEDSLGSNSKYQQKMEKYLKKLKINIINPPRPGKKLLVLDLDYTLFDMKSKADTFAQLKRPFTDFFLTQCYRYYDLVIWSQTSWRWLEIKLTELGILSHPHYKICFVLDKSCMFSVKSKIRGEERSHQVKALGLIWAKFPQWSAKNSLHVDDLGRNFAMNPGEGLKIKAYKNASVNRNSDSVLLFLWRYLTIIARDERDFEDLDHNEWESYLRENGHKITGDDIGSLG